MPALKAEALILLKSTALARYEKDPLGMVKVSSTLPAAVNSLMVDEPPLATSQSPPAKRRALPHQAEKVTFGSVICSIIAALLPVTRKRTTLGARAAVPLS